LLLLVFPGLDFFLSFFKLVPVFLFFGLVTFNFFHYSGSVFSILFTFSDIVFCLILFSFFHTYIPKNKSKFEKQSQIPKSETEEKKSKKMKKKSLRNEEQIDVQKREERLSLKRKKILV